MLTYLFPGQGAQFKGMGKELFQQFAEHTAIADELLGYSIETLCTEDPDSLLRNTLYTQPALYVVNALSYLHSLEHTGEKPDYVAGHSLGEYNALFAAGVFDFSVGLTLVKKRSELMSKAPKGGGMAAVLGLTEQELLHILSTHDINTVTIANYNSYQQMVISGPANDIARVGSLLELNKKVRVIPLSVSGAFHSSYMSEAQHSFSEFLEPFMFSVPRIPIISNINADLYHPAMIKKHLAQQITHSVEWTKTMDFLKVKPNMNFKEIGPGTVLTGLLQRIVNGE